MEKTKGNNNRRDKLLHSLWLTKQEYKDLIVALDTNDNERVKDLIFLVYLRKDLI